MTKEDIIDVIHNTIYQFFDVCGDNEEVPLSDKDELLLSVNKAICNNIKALEEEPFMNKPCISAGVCEHDKQKVLDKIRAEIKALNPEPTAFDVVDGNPIKDAVWETLADVVKIIDKYRKESEK